MRLTAAPTSPDRPHDASWRASCAVASAICLGIAIHIRDGLVHPGAILRPGGTPRIDVWTAQTAGLDALRHGRDPWSSTFPDVYHNPDLYAPGTVRDGVVHLGFPYPPLTVLLDLPAHFLFGDFRYANLLAMLAAAALIAAARPGPTSALLATLFLFTPRAFLVLRN